MTTPMIEIVNGDTRIAFPLAALVHFDKVVDLAHLTILSEPVRLREATAVEDALASVADAAKSSDPMAALRQLAEGVKKRQDSELTAEKLEKGQKPGEDPAVRLLEHARKCAESLGINPPENTPISAIITAIAKLATERESVLTIWAETLNKELRSIGIEPCDEVGAAALHKNLNTLGKHAHTFSARDKQSALAAAMLHKTLAVFGVEIQARPAGSTATIIGDATNAISVAGRRGYRLAEKVQG